MAEMKNSEKGSMFCLSDMSRDDLRSMLTMIRSANLPERRYWNRIGKQIERILDEE
jgi:hypothetical protein